MKTKRSLRKCFIIEPHTFGYDVWCAVEGCEYESRAWDYRRNALLAGYLHSRAAHED